VTLTLSSPVLAEDRKIPSLFSRDGGNVSPPVQWLGAPEGTRGFALIVEDADAPGGIFRHWAVFDIPAHVCGLTDGAGSEQAAAPLRMGINDFGHPHYDGPQPPLGDGSHHYRFRLFALDVPELGLPAAATAEDVLRAALDHVLAEADLVGTFEELQPAPSDDNVGPHYHPAPPRTQGRTSPGPVSGVRNTPPFGKWDDTT
jgi:Raf kinase inhibitor-like YbhB/YbcL family protein